MQPPTQLGSSSTLADVLTRHRKAAGLSVNEVARLAGVPLTTTQRRFQDASGITQGELVAIASVLGTRPSVLQAEAEASAQETAA